MKLKPFVSAQKVVMDLPAASRREVLAALSAPLVADGVVIDSEQFVTDLECREDQVTTVMDSTVALPHARSEAVRRLGLTVGIAMPDGVVFGPDETVHSRLFFCIAVPAFAPTAHIPLLQVLAAFARDEPRVRKLLACRTRGAAAKLLGAFSG